MDAFLWLKNEILFSVNVYVFIPMVLFIIKKMRFSFRVNVYVFIPMVLFYS